MIVHIDDSVLDNDVDQVIDDTFKICRLIANGHFISVSGILLPVLRKLVDENVTPGLREIFKGARNMINPSPNKQKYLRTVEWSELDEIAKRVLFFKPSELLVENGPYEWNVYKRLINAYTEDRRFGDVFICIQRMIDKYNLVPANAGGKQTIVEMIKLKNEEEYQGLYAMKSCTVFDRDTKNDTYFSDDNDRLFALFAAKDHDSISNNDIYKLNFGDGLVWHMWYKHAIENYFPIEEYEKLGIDMTKAREAEDFAYFKFESSAKDGRYHKKHMKEIGKDLHYDDYELNLKKFGVNGVQYSEIQLLLLKIASII